MSRDEDLIAARRRYAETLRQSGLRSPTVVRAFATVPREQFLGPGPWQVLKTVPRGYRTTPDADPIHLYHDLPVGIDPARLLNNGQPSFVAGLIDALDLAAGEHVVHVGAGTGYYTAILATVVGSGGRVDAIEVDAKLAARARSNLADWPQVHVVHANGGEYDPGPADAIFVNAGATHPRSLWLDRLRIGGRLLLPLVRWPSDRSDAGAAGTGIVLRVTRQERGDAARILCSCMFFPCIGAVDADADRRLAAALARMPEADAVRTLRRDPHEIGTACWLHGDGFCLSTLPL